MDKYIVKVPYSFVRCGQMECEVYAESVEEACELAVNPDTRYADEFNDLSDEDGSLSYDWDSADAEVDDCDITWEQISENRIQIMSQIERDRIAAAIESGRDYDNDDDDGHHSDDDDATVTLRHRLTGWVQRTDATNPTRPSSEREAIENLAEDIDNI